MTNWQNRIISTGEEQPDQLLANPANWRIHPKGQQDVLEGVLSQVGWVQQVIVNKRTGNLVDGHLRVTLALRHDEKSIPVNYIDVSPEEEALILATLDPIAGMAAADKDKLDALLRQVQSDDERVQAMLEDIAIKQGIIPPPEIDYDQLWQGMPEFEQEDLEGIQIIKVHFQTIKDRDDFAKLINQKLTDNTRSIWYPERPEELRDQLPRGLIYTDES